MPPRKGGGRKAFLKGLKKHDSDSEGESGQPVSTKAADQGPVVASDSLSEPAASSSAMPNHQDGDAPQTQQVAEEDNSSAASQGETKGQLLQRHKREVKALKDKVKKLGKKNKDEVDRLEKEMQQRHSAELEALEAQVLPSDQQVPAVATMTDSLYTAKLGTAAEEMKLKPTKAQKRREKLEKDEAEREARIAEEQAALGDSERVVEEANLSALLQPLGLAIRDVPPDGHCMYRAVEDQLAAAAAPGGDAAPGYQELRSRTAAHMRQHRADFLPFVTPEDVETEGKEEHFERYCGEVEGSAAWGGQVELQALAQALQAHIVVHSVGLPAVHMGTEFQGKGPTLQVCYQRHAYELGEHYNSVVPATAMQSEEDEHDEERQDS